MKHSQKSVLLLLCVFFSLPIFAQNKKIQFGVKFFPNYSWGIISNDGQTPDAVEQAIRDIEEGRLSNSVQLFGEFRPTQALAISIGLGLQTTGQSVKITEIIGFMPNDPALPESVRNDYVFRYAEVPITFKYYARPRLYTEIGASTSFLLHAFRRRKQTFSSGEVEIDRDEYDSVSWRTPIFHLQGGIGYEIVQQPFMTVFVQPTFQFATQRQSTDASLNRRQLAAGIIVGVRR